MKEIIQTDQACRPVSPIAQGTKANGFIFTTGQLGRDPQTGKLGSTLEDQVRLALANVKAVVEAGGGDLTTVLKIEAYVTDLNHVPVFNEYYRRYFPENSTARRCVEVSRLSQDALIVIDAVAVVKT